MDQQNINANEEEIDLNPPTLYINQEERNFLLALAPILTRSPRVLKRFVNVYRLIKVGMNDSQWEVYYQKISPDLTKQWSFRNFEVVMFLLAIVTGMPNSSRLFFQSFRDQKRTSNNLNNILESMNVVYSSKDNLWTLFDQPHTSIPEIIKLSVNNPSLASEKLQNATIYNMQLEILNFVKWLEEWNEPGITKDDWLKMDINQILYWEPYVSRYSFRIDPQL